MQEEHGRDADSGTPAGGEWRYHLAVLLAAGLALTAAWGCGIAEGKVRVAGPALPTICPLVKIAGVPCPSCGIVRSLVACSHGRWREAVGYSVAGVVFFGMLAGQIPFRVFLLSKTSVRCVQTRRLDAWLLGGFLVFAAGWRLLAISYQ